MTWPNDLDQSGATAFSLLEREGPTFGRVENFVPASTVALFTTVTPGIVPASGGGTNNFLRADGIWTVPPGGGGGGGGTPGGSTGQVQYNNSGAFGGLTNAQLTADINVFTSGLSGATPASGGGTTNFLRADGAWAAPAGGGTPGGSSGQVQFNNAGAFGGLTNTQLTADINVFTSTLSGAVAASGGGTTNFLRADGSWAAPPGGGGSAPLLLNFGTITTNPGQPSPGMGLTIQGIWNGSGVVFNAPLFMSITKTLASNNSLLADFQVGSTTQFAVGINPSGGDGSLIKGTGSTSLLLSNSDGVNLTYSNASINIVTGVSIGAASGGVNVTLGGSNCTPDVRINDNGFIVHLVDDNDNFTRQDTLGQRNGANSQSYRIYNTFTDSSNYERAVIDWKITSNIFTFGTIALGTGTVRDSRWVKGTNIMRTTETTVVASLPAAGVKGRKHFVTDANATMTAGIGAVVAGSGTNNVPVYDDGTNWRIG